MDYNYFINIHCSTISKYDQALAQQIGECFKNRNKETLLTVLPLVSLKYKSNQELIIAEQVLTSICYNLHPLPWYSQINIKIQNYISKNIVTLNK